MATLAEIAKGSRQQAVKPKEKEEDKGFFGGLVDLWGDVVSAPTKIGSQLPKFAWEAGDTLMSGAQAPGGLIDVAAENLGAPQWLRSGLGVINPLNYPAMLRDEFQGEHALDEMKNRFRRVDYYDEQGNVVKRESPLEALDRTTKTEVPVGREMLWESPQRTVRRLGETAYEAGTGDFSNIPYYRALQEGNLFDTVIEDAGNLALVGELGGSGLSAAARAATKAENAARLGAVADTPVAQAAADVAGASRTATTTTPTAQAAADVAQVSRIGEALRPYAPQLRAASEAVGTGTDVANRIAGAPLLPFQYAGKGVAKGARVVAPGLVDDIATGVNSYFAARKAQGLAQGETSAASEPFVKQTQEVYNQLQDELTPAEFEALMVDRAGFGNRPYLDLYGRVQDSGQGSLLDSPARAVSPEVAAELEKLRAARGNLDPTPEQVSYLARMDEAAAKFDELQQVQDARRAAAEGEQFLPPLRGTPEGDRYWANRDAELGDAPIQGYIDRDLANDPQWAAAKQIVDDWEQNGSQGSLLGGEPAEVTAARDALARLEEGPTPIPRGLGDARRQPEIPAEPAAENLPPLFHGASRPLPGDTPYVGYGSQAGNLLGGDFYATASEDMARSYLTKGKGNEPSLYGVKWAGDEAPRILDAEAAMPDTVAERAARWFEESDRNPIREPPFDGRALAAMVRGGASLADVVRELRDQMADAGISRSYADEMMDGFLHGTVAPEFDVMRYQGGVRAGKGRGELHEAYAFLDGDKLRVAPRPVENPNAAIDAGVDLYENTVRPNLPKPEPLAVRPAPKGAGYDGLVDSSPVESVVPGAEVRFTRPTEDMPATVEVWAPDGGDMNPVGTFQWNPTTGEIDAVVTHPRMQGQGIGSALFETADRIADDLGISRPKHSSDLTPEGEAYAASLARKDAERATENLKAKAEPQVPEEVAAAQKRMADREARLKDNPKYLPAEWRIAVEGHRDLAKAAKGKVSELREAGLDDAADELQATLDELPLTVEQMLEAGYDRPTHVYGGEGDGNWTPTEGMPGRKSPMTTRKTSGERMRDSGAKADLSPQRQFQEMVSNHVQQNANIAVRRIAETMNQDALPVLDELRAEFGDDVDAITAAMAERGYAPLDLTTMKRADEVVLGEVPGKRATVWVPEGAEKGLRAAVEPIMGAESKIMQGFDKGQNLWKIGVLPLNPKWLVNNVLGNSIVVAAKVGLREVFSAEVWRNTRKAIANPDEYVSSILRRGVTEFDLGDVLGDGVVPRERGPIRQVGHKTIEGAYRANQYVDNFAHAFIYTAEKAKRDGYLADLKKQLDDGEITPERYETLTRPPEKVRGGGPKAYTNEQIAHEALKYAGDFANMSRVERGIIRRIFPFYAWTRHITELTFRLPVENPYRVAWTLKLGQMVEGDEELPSWLRGAVDLGNGNFLRGSFNPFSGAVGADNPLMTPSGALASTTPFIQWPLAVFGNISGRGPINPAVDQPGFIGVPSTVGYLANSFPLSRVLADTVQGPYARNKDRSPVLSRGRPIENSVLGGRWSSPAQYLTGFTVAQPDLEMERVKEARRKRREARQR